MTEEGLKLVQTLAEREGAVEAPTDLNLADTQPVELPDVEWRHYDNPPIKLVVTNTGHTVNVGGKWECNRSYLRDGPFKGNYVFAQMHFHWGPTDDTGSEHSVEQRKLPLEMHVVHINRMYRSQEIALKEKDGVAIVTYLFEIQEEDNTDIEPIISALPLVSLPQTSTQIDPVPIGSLLLQFQRDYLLYWGSVSSPSCQHVILWLTCRVPLGISSEQLSKFRQVRDLNGQFMVKNYRETHPRRNHTLLHVSPSSKLDSTLLSTYPGHAKVQEAQKLQEERLAEELRKTAAEEPPGEFVTEEQSEGGTDQLGSLNAETAAAAVAEAKTAGDEAATEEAVAAEEPTTEADIYEAATVHDAPAEELMTEADVYEASTVVEAPAGEDLTRAEIDYSEAAGSAMADVGDKAAEEREEAEALPSRSTVVDEEAESMAPPTSASRVSKQPSGASKIASAPKLASTPSKTATVPSKAPSKTASISSKAGPAKSMPASSGSTSDPRSILTPVTSPTEFAPASSAPSTTAVPRVPSAAPSRSASGVIGSSKLSSRGLPVADQIPEQTEETGSGTEERHVPTVMPSATSQRRVSTTALSRKSGIRIHDGSGPAPEHKKSELRVTLSEVPLVQSSEAVDGRDSTDRRESSLRGMEGTDSHLLCPPCPQCPPCPPCPPCPKCGSPIYRYSHEGLQDEHAPGFVKEDQSQIPDESCAPCPPCPPSSLESGPSKAVTAADFGSVYAPEDQTTLPDETEAGELEESRASLPNESRAPDRRQSRVSLSDRRQSRASISDRRQSRASLPDGSEAPDRVQSRASMTDRTDAVTREQSRASVRDVLKAPEHEQSRLSLPNETEADEILPSEPVASEIQSKATVEEHTLASAKSGASEAKSASARRPSTSEPRVEKTSEECPPGYVKASESGECPPGYVRVTAAEAKAASRRPLTSENRKEKTSDECPPGYVKASESTGECPPGYVKVTSAELHSVSSEECPPGFVKSPQDEPCECPPGFVPISGSGVEISEEECPPGYVRASEVATSKAPEQASDHRPTASTKDFPDARSEISRSKPQSDVRSAPSHVSREQPEVKSVASQPKQPSGSKSMTSATAPSTKAPTSQEEQPSDGRSTVSHTKQPSGGKSATSQPTQHSDLKSTLTGMSATDAESAISQRKQASDLKSAVSQAKSVTGAESTTSQVKQQSDVKSTVSQAKSVTGAESVVSQRKQASDVKSAVSQSKSVTGAESTTSQVKQASDVRSTVSQGKSVIGPESTASQVNQPSDVKSTVSQAKSVTGAESAISQRKQASDVISTVSQAKSVTGAESTTSQVKHLSDVKSVASKTKSETGGESAISHAKHPDVKSSTSQVKQPSNVRSAVSHTEPSSGEVSADSQAKQSPDVTSGISHTKPPPGDVSTETQMKQSHDARSTVSHTKPPDGSVSGATQAQQPRQDLSSAYVDQRLDGRSAIDPSGVKSSHSREPAVSRSTTQQLGSSSDGRTAQSPGVQPSVRSATMDGSERPDVGPSASRDKGPVAGSPRQAFISPNGECPPGYVKVCECPPGYVKVPIYPNAGSDGCPPGYVRVPLRDAGPVECPPGYIRVSELQAKGLYHNGSLGREPGLPAQSSHEISGSHKKASSGIHPEPDPSRRTTASAPSHASHEDHRSAVVKQVDSQASRIVPQLSSSKTASTKHQSSKSGKSLGSSGGSNPASAMESVERVPATGLECCAPISSRGQPKSGPPSRSGSGTWARSSNRGHKAKPSECLPDKSKTSMSANNAEAETDIGLHNVRSNDANIGPNRKISERIRKNTLSRASSAGRVAAEEEFDQSDNAREPSRKSSSGRSNIRKSDTVRSLTDEATFDREPGTPVSCDELHSHRSAASVKFQDDGLRYGHSCVDPIAEMAISERELSSDLSVPHRSGSQLKASTSWRYLGEDIEKSRHTVRINEKPHRMNDDEPSVHTLPRAVSQDGTSATAMEGMLNPEDEPQLEPPDNDYVEPGEQMEEPKHVSIETAARREYVLDDTAEEPPDFSGESERRSGEGDEEQMLFDVEDRPVGESGEGILPEGDIMASFVQDDPFQSVAIEPEPTEESPEEPPSELPPLEEPTDDGPPEIVERIEEAPEVSEKTIGREISAPSEVEKVEFSGKEIVDYKMPSSPEEGGGAEKLADASEVPAKVKSRPKLKTPVPEELPSGPQKFRYFVPPSSEQIKRSPKPKLFNGIAITPAVILPSPARTILAMKNGEQVERPAHIPCHGKALKIYLEEQAIWMREQAMKRQIEEENEAFENLPEKVRLGLAAESARRRKWNRCPQTGPEYNIPIQKGWPFESFEPSGPVLSPIDIVLHCVIDQRLAPLCYEGHFFPPAKSMITNTGDTLEIRPLDPNCTPVLHGGPLPDDYTFESMHFHWNNGPGPDCLGGAHRINGQRYCMEGHMIHFKTEYKSKEEALKHEGGICSVAFMLQVGGTENECFAKLSRELTRVCEPQSKATLDFNALIAFCCRACPYGYVTYPGTLIGHQDLVNVIWIVYPEPIDICCQNIIQFQKLRPPNSKSPTGAIVTYDVAKRPVLRAVEPQH